ncbi:hypothetical protein BDW75DRAFT_226634 [Aspergillus navahoensis]
MGHKPSSQHDPLQLSNAVIGHRPRVGRSHIPSPCGRRTSIWSSAQTAQMPPGAVST